MAGRAECEQQWREALLREGALQKCEGRGSIPKHHRRPDANDAIPTPPHPLIAAAIGRVATAVCTTIHLHHEPHRQREEVRKCSARRAPLAA
jgi:hypothetical protein